MKLIQKAVATFAVALFLYGTMQAPAQDAARTTRITAKEAHALMKSAHEQAQYQELAAYYRQQEQSYRAKRDEALALWNTRAQGVAVNQNKYPRPVDSAHNLYDYYAYETDHAATQVQRCEQMTSVAQSK
jgi:hypothetical protein